jgi:hypothetical protein
LQNLIFFSWLCQKKKTSNQSHQVPDEIVQKIDFLCLISQNVAKRFKASFAWLKYKSNTTTSRRLAVLTTFRFWDKILSKWQESLICNYCTNATKAIFRDPYLKNHEELNFHNSTKFEYRVVLQVGTVGLH